MQLQACLIQGSKMLTEAGVDSPRLCAQLLVQEALQLSRLQCIQEPQRELTQAEEDSISALLSRRAGGEPLAYILGHREFYGRRFNVTPDTLIPRPDTETVVEKALQLLGQDRQKQGLLLDLGTGSGCLGLTLLLEMPTWHGLLLDISAGALRTAAENSRFWELTARAALVQADLQALPLKPESCHLVAANPPYIAREEQNDVMPEVLRFEPHSALFSPEQGLLHLKATIREAARVLRRGGWLVLEHGWKQANFLRNYIKEQGFFSNIGTCQDLAGQDRCTFAKKV